MKYIVQIEELAVYELTVKADSEEAAIEIAEQRFLKAISISDKKITCDVRERHVEIAEPHHD